MEVHMLHPQQLIGDQFGEKQEDPRGEYAQKCLDSGTLDGGDHLPKAHMVKEA